MNYHKVLAVATLGVLLAGAPVEAEVLKAWRLQDGAWKEIELIDLAIGVHPNSGPFILQCGRGPVCFSVASRDAEPSISYYAYDPQGEFGAKGKFIMSDRCEYKPNVAKGDRRGGAVMGLYSGSFNDKTIFVEVSAGLEPVGNGFIVQSRLGQ